MYAAYVREKTNDLILENDKGFATYTFLKNECWIKDIYVHPDFRKLNVASELANEIVEIAKKEGCSKLIGSVVPSTKNSTASLKVLLAYGFLLDSSGNDFVLFKKDI